MVSIVKMENFYYSSLPFGTNWPQCNSAPGIDFPLSVQTPVLPHVSDSASVQFFEVPSWPVLPIEGPAEDRAASASKSHSQAEKRRRDRINAQLATLRKLIPKSDKVFMFFWWFS